MNQGEDERYIASENGDGQQQAPRDEANQRFGTSTETLAG
jgi:hypothetical protein